MPRIPIGDWIENAIDFLSDVLEPVADLFVNTIDASVDGLALIFGLHPIIIGVVTFAAAWWATGWGLALFVTFSMLLIGNMGLWEKTADTLSLMTVAVLISILLGIPLGMLMGEFDRFWKVSEPVLDFFQTLHPFVYLIPSVIAFGIGAAPAVTAAVLYTIPLPIRLTHLGIRNVNKEVVEAGHAFGGTRWQILFKIKMPLALKSILAGINQTILITLSFIVIAALIGAGGLGEDIIRGITRLMLDIGFEAGIAVVLVAITLDRLSRGATEVAMRRFGELPEV